MRESIRERYLTDEELKALILQVEEQELISAPGDMAERIMAAVDGSGDVAPDGWEKAAEPIEMIRDISRPPENKRNHLLRYSMRVVLSAAASIAILFAMPTASDLSEGMVRRSQERQEEAYERSVRLKDERRKGYEEREGETDWLEFCNRGTSGLCSMLNNFTTNMLK